MDKREIKLVINDVGFCFLKIPAVQRVGQSEREKKISQHFAR